MTALQADLFGHVPAPAMKPNGFDYWPEVLSAIAQAELAAQLQSLNFKPYEHMGYLGFRRIAAFGRRYAWPVFLQVLLVRLTERLGLDRGHFVQALVNDYAPGPGIGWHRDRPVYGEILGVSLLAPCAMRLGQKDGAGWRRSAAPLEPGSAYRLSGEARREWEYSITFRALA